MNHFSAGPRNNCRVRQEGSRPIAGRYPQELFARFWPKNKKLRRTRNIVINRKWTTSETATMQAIWSTFFVFLGRAAGEICFYLTHNWHALSATWGRGERSKEANYVTYFVRTYGGSHAGGGVTAAVGALVSRWLDESTYSGRQFINWTRDGRKGGATKTRRKRTAVDADVHHGMQ